MSTTRGNDGRVTPGGWVTAAGRGLAAVIAGLMLALTGASLASAQNAPAAVGPNQLQDIQVQPLPGDRVELRLLTSGPASVPLSFTIDNPARISLDLQGTTLALPSRRKDVKMGPLDTILAAEAEGRTRVVLNLDRMVPYQTRVDGNAVVVTLGTATAADAAVTTFPAAAPAGSVATAAATPAAGRRIEQMIPEIDWSNITFLNLLDDLKPLLMPFILGTLLMGSIASIVCYIIIYMAAKKHTSFHHFN